MINIKFINFKKINEIACIIYLFRETDIIYFLCNNKKIVFTFTYCSKTDENFGFPFQVKKKNVSTLLDGQEFEVEGSTSRAELTPF